MQYGFETLLHIGFGSYPGGDANPHCGTSLPDGSATPRGAILLYAFNYPLGFVGVAERDKNLVKLHIVQHLIAGCCQPIGKTPRVLTAPFYHFRQTSPPQ